MRWYAGAHRLVGASEQAFSTWCMSMKKTPLSRRIARLEHELECGLIVLSGRWIAYTPTGRAFPLEARRLLSLAGSAADPARRVATGKMDYTISALWLAPDALLPSSAHAPSCHAKRAPHAESSFCFPIFYHGSALLYLSRRISALTAADSSLTRRCM